MGVISAKVIKKPRLRRICESCAEMMPAGEPQVRLYGCGMCGDPPYAVYTCVKCARDSGDKALRAVRDL